MLVDETGGIHGIRDRRAILSLENAPKQNVFWKELYPNVFEKAAVYARDIIMNHPFVDGNKRTGMTVASVFLEDNGYNIETKRGEIEKFALKIIRGKLEIKAIAAWFENNSRKTKSKA